MIGLYAMVASCSSGMDASRSALHGLSGEWRVEDASQRPVTIARGVLAVDSACAPDAPNATVNATVSPAVDTKVRATVNARGRLVTRVHPSCEADGFLRFVGEGPELVRIDARTLELRHRRERMRIRKA